MKWQKAQESGKVQHLKFGEDFQQLFEVLDPARSLEVSR
jgi:hypothetical protein